MFREIKRSDIKQESHIPAALSVTMLPPYSAIMRALVGQNEPAI